MRFSRLAIAAPLLFAAFLAGCAPSTPAPMPVSHVAAVPVPAPAALPVVEPVASPVAVPVAAPIAPLGTTPFTPLATASAGRIALDEARVYWIDNHLNQFGGSDKPARLLSAPRAGGPSVELLTTPTSASKGIAVDDAYVYVGYVGQDEPNPNRCPPGRMCTQPPTIHGPTGGLLAVPKQGGAPRVLAAGARDPLWVVADGRDVYWVDGEQVFRVARDGGAPALLLAGEKYRALTLDQTHLYCLGNGISRVLKAGGASERLFAGDAYQYALALGPTTLYFDGVEAVRRAVARPQTNFRGTGQGFSSPPDPWIDSFSAVMALGKGGGAARTLVRAQGGKFIVVDAKGVYWVEDGRLSHVAIAGGKSVLRSDIGIGDQVDGLAIDASQVYWVTSEGALEHAAR